MMNHLNSLEKLVIRLLQNLVGLHRSSKLVLMLATDASLCIAAVWIAFSLRLGEWDLWSPAIAIVGAACLLFWLPIFLWHGVYRSLIRFTGSRTMVGIASSCFFLMLVLILLFSINSVGGIPRTISIIQPLVFAALLMMSRLVARYILFDLLNQRRFLGQQRGVLIYGAGSAGRQLALSIRHEPGMLLRGYIDDDLRLSGQHLDGVQIHSNDDLGQLIAVLDVDTILLALPRISRQQRERVVRRLDGISVAVLTLPAVQELVDGKVSVTDLREIEVSDLLGRDPVPPNHLLLHKTITGKTVMVTGAGGSIGSELCRQICQLKPKRLVLVEMTEHALYTIDAELREWRDSSELGEEIEIVAELGSVSHRDSVRRLFSRWRPETVFHAAAYKHVPLVEENAIAGMHNNIQGTLYCASEAEESGVSNFILVSTDKAVRPTNVMGASKRVCELVLQALDERGSKTRFAMVRFGNVLGSSGSVVPRFQRQIRMGGPVTLTHRDVTRYFMTIPEAAQLVIQAGAMAEGGEVYVLDMGEPVRIFDLARTMIRLSGLTVRDAGHPDGDIEIREIGLRPGEKLYEELLIGGSHSKTRHPRVMQAREHLLPWSELELKLDAMRELLSKGEREESITLLSDLVPEYSGGAKRDGTAAAAPGAA